MEFEKKVPEWNAAGSEPPASLKNSGFTAGYKPPAPYFNWFWNAVSVCLTEIRSKLKGHAEDQSNPHAVTKTQIGLGNVPNVATNDQTPTYSDTTTLATLASGEKLNVAFQKIKCAITNLINHLNNKNNPHSVTASQIGAAEAKALDNYLPLTGGALTGALTVIDNFNINKTFDDVEYKTYIRPTNYALGDEYTTALIHYVNGVNNSQLLFNRSGVLLRDNVEGKASLIYGQHNVATMRSETLNRETKVNAHDTNYTTLMARGTSLHAADTNPTANGAICWTYK